MVERAVRLIEGNRERFSKAIRARDGATGRLALAPDPSGGIDAIRRFVGRPLPQGRTRAVLARTNRELVVPAALALELGVPFAAPGVRLLLEDPRVDDTARDGARTPPIPDCPCSSGSGWSATEPASARPRPIASLTRTTRR